MATFPSPSQISANYFSYLKAAKPSINVNDKNSDFVIRGNVFSGILSGAYGDQRKIYNDTFFNSARPEALALHGQDLGKAAQPATPAASTKVRLSGTNGTIVNPGDVTFVYLPTNVLYSNTTGGTVASGILDVEVTCEVNGQVGNIAAPDTLQVVSPPAGIQTTAQLVNDMTDGADAESTDSYRARLLSRLQSPPAGGNETDYPQFAFDADPTVRSAFIRRFGRGLGTVDVYITTGTTDIDTAVTQGLPVLRIPSPTVLANVQAYYNAHVPLTDCPAVYAPSEVNVAVTARVVLAAGLTLTSVPADPTYNPLGLTCQQLVQREVSRVLYKLPVGGRVLPGGSVGYVVAADIENGLAVWLSAVTDPTTGLLAGKLPILADWQIDKLDPPDYDLALGQNELAAPGVISVVLGV